MTAATLDDRTFAVDPAEVVHETLDGETVLIHLPSGVYFSLTGWGPAVWALLAGGHTVASAAGAVAARGGAAEDVGALADRLVAEALLTPGPAGDATDAADTAEVWRGVPAQYAPPQLARYDDMQYLLLLDPIHEAADTGWPARAVAAS